jgi:hypothetical protein
VKLIWITGALVAALASYGVAQAPLPGPMVGAIGAPVPFVSAQNAGTDVICALHADVITGLTCNNAVTDGTAETAFATTVTIPAGVLANTTVGFNMVLGYVTTGATPTLLLKIRYGGVSGTVIYAFPGPGIGGSASTGAVALSCRVTAAGSGAATPLIVGCNSNSGFTAGVANRNAQITNSALSVAADTRASQTMAVTATWSANTTGNAIWLYSVSAQ